MKFELSNRDGLDEAASGRGAQPAHDSRLVARKLDLYAALRRLEQDHRDGLVDDAAYEASRKRYEAEAAEVLEELDAGATDAAAREQAPPLAGWRSPLVIGGAGVLVIAAMVLLLVTALHPRLGGQSATGDTPASGAPPPSPRVLAAERAVRAHPRSVDVRIDLGNAFFDNRDLAQADQSYREAMQLDPSRPEPPTLHAMMLGLGQQYPQGIALLRQVERAHPTYSRAWLLDGLLSYDNRAYSQAIAAWRHFLRLNPKGRVADSARRLLAAAQRAEGKKG